MRSALRCICFIIITSVVFTSCQKDVANNSVLNYLAPPVANAGPSKVIQAPASTVTLAGSGTTQNGYITGYLWSLVSGPNVPVIASPSSPTTAINNLVAGNYIFQFIVIDSAGLTGVDTASVLVKPSLTQTLSLQPTNSPNELTMWLNSGGTNTSDAASPQLDVAAWTQGGSPVTLRNLIKFDLSSIPAGATILSAKLTLYSNHTPLTGNLMDANFGTNNAMYIERVNGTWTSTTLWQNQPGTDASTQVLIPHTSLSFLDLVDVDVTSQVTDMKTIANYGFKLRLQNEVAYTNRCFCSSRYSDATRHPKLVITYQ